MLNVESVGSHRHLRTSPSGVSEAQLRFWCVLMLSESTAASIKPQGSLLAQGERQRLPAVRQGKTQEAFLENTEPYRITLEKVN